MKSNYVEIRYFEIVSGVKKQYKDIKPKYRSNFNKVVKIHDTHRIYCEVFDWSDLDEDLVPTDVIQELVMIKLSDSIHNILYPYNLINN